MSYTTSAMSYTIYPTASSTPSFNLFIPSSSSSSREMHEMYGEFGLILRPSNRQNSYGSTSSKSSKASSTKSKSSLRKWLGDLRYAPTRHQPSIIGAPLGAVTRITRVFIAGHERRPVLPTSEAVLHNADASAVDRCSSFQQII